MNISHIFSTLDGATLTISGIFFAIWVSIHFSLFEAVGDLIRIRRMAIYSCANKNAGTELVQFLDQLQAESRYLLIEPKRSNLMLKVSLIIFLVISIATIGYPTWERVLPPRDVLLYFYAGSLAIATLSLWSEVHYFRAFRQLERQFTTEDRPDRNKILIGPGQKDAKINGVRLD